MSVREGGGRHAYLPLSGVCLKAAGRMGAGWLLRAWFPADCVFVCNLGLWVGGGILPVVRVRSVNYTAVLDSGFVWNTFPSLRRGTLRVCWTLLCLADRQKKDLEYLYSDRHGRCVSRSGADLDSCGGLSWLSTSEHAHSPAILPSMTTVYYRL